MSIAVKLPISVSDSSTSGIGKINVSDTSAGASSSSATAVLENVEVVTTAKKVVHIAFQSLMQTLKWCWQNPQQIPLALVMALDHEL